MAFPFNVYLLAIISAGVTTAVALPFWRRWCLRTGLVDDPGHRKIHEHPIPLAGGLAVMTGLLVPALVATGVVWWLWLAQPAPGAGDSTPRLFPALDANTLQQLGYGLTRRALQVAAIFIGALGMLILGWWDDKHELRPGAKFLGQLLVATLVAAGGARITLFVPSAFASYALTILWILTLVNAVNFMDNMNGLCAGVGAIGAWHFGMLAAVEGQYLVALIAFLIFGALLGFLPYNFPTARAFLGDAGSHLVGYLLAVLAILPHFHTSRQPRPWAVLIPLLVLGVPLLDLVRVVILRWRIGQPFYVGDTNHLSHWLVRLGLSRTAAVLVLWLAAAIFGTVALVLF